MGRSTRFDVIWNGTVVYEGDNQGVNVAMSRAHMPVGRYRMTVEPAESVDWTNRPYEFREGWNMAMQKSYEAGEEIRERLAKVEAQQKEWLASDASARAEAIDEAIEALTKLAGVCEGNGEPVHAHAARETCRTVRTLKGDA